MKMDMPPLPAASTDAVTAWGTWLSGAAPMLTPIITLFGGWIIGRRDRAKRAIAERDDHDAKQIEAMTKRFQALMDAAEARIADLMQEVHSLRIEVRSLRTTLDKRPRGEHEDNPVVDQY